ILKWAAIGVGVLVVISVIAGNSDKNATEPSAAASARTPSDPVVLAEDQKKFIETVNYYRTQFLSADNPLQESRFRNERKNAIRNLVGSGSINGWVGTIHSMNTTMDGKAIVEFRIDPNVLVGTWNNALS